MIQMRQYFRAPELRPRHRIIFELRSKSLTALSSVAARGAGDMAMELECAGHSMRLFTLVSILPLPIYSNTIIVEDILHHSYN